MSYSKEIFKIALSKLEEIREHNKNELELRKSEVIRKIPEYKNLRDNLIELLGDCIKSLDNKNYQLDKLKEEIKKNAEKRKELLKRNGFEADYLEIKYNCEKCKDTGYIISERCDCLNKILRETAFLKSNLNYIMAEENFDNFDLNLYSDKNVNDDISPRENIKIILVHVSEFINEFETPDTKSLLFTGNSGVGKTFLASCIAKELLSKGYNVLYQSAGQLVEILEEYKFNKSDSSYDINSIIENIYDTDLLIIDDLGTEFNNNYTVSAIYELINKRLISNKKMLITTNLSAENLKDVYTERLFSRFIGEFKILEFIGEDLRAKKMLEIVE